MYKTIQLKKKVTRLKIYHFLKKNKLVLFLHYNVPSISSQSTHTTSNQLLLNEPTNLLLIKNRIAQRLVLAQLSESAGTLFDFDNENIGSNRIEEEPIRNKALFRKATERSFTPSNQIVQEKIELSNSVQPAVELSCKKTLSCKKYKPLNPVQRERPEENRCQLIGIQSKEQREKKERGGEKIVFFHGPSALLGVVDITRLVDILKIYKKQDKFFLFGGLYNNQILSHTQVERLAVLSQKQENLLYSELVNCLQKPSLKALLTVQSCTPFFYLKKVQRRLIEIFNFRNNQLSMQGNQ